MDRACTCIFFAIYFANSRRVNVEIPTAFKEQGARSSSDVAEEDGSIKYDITNYLASVYYTGK
jgi:hypothetical protein